MTLSRATTRLRTSAMIELAKLHENGTYGKTNLARAYAILSVANSLDAAQKIHMLNDDQPQEMDREIAISGGYAKTHGAGSHEPRNAQCKDVWWFASQFYIDAASHGGLPFAGPSSERPRKTQKFAEVKGLRMIFRSTNGGGTVRLF